MYGKTIGEKVSLLFSFVVISLLIYAGSTWAINRIVGPDDAPGDGLVRRDGGAAIDTLHVLPDWTMRINTDSVGIDTTNLWTIATLHYAARGDISDTLWAHLDDTSAVLWTAVHDTAWMLRGAMHDTMFANTPGYLTTVGSGDITDQTIVKADIDTTSTFVVGAAYHITSATSDSMFMSKVYIDAVSGGDASKADIHDSLFANTPGYSTNSEIHDSLNANWATWLDGDASEADIHDSLFANTPGYITAYTQFWGENDLAISIGTDDKVDVFFPVSEKFGDLTHPYFVRSINSGGASDDDQKDTIIFSGRLPLNFNADIDSITLPYRTSSITGDSSGIKAVVYAMKDLIGFAPADTVKAVGAQIASASAGVWSWLTFVMADSSAIGAGSWIMVLVECNLDYSVEPETVDVERPYFWGVAK